MKCIYCSSDASIDKKTELDLERVISVIDEVKTKFGVNTISLSGGEAFHYSRFDEIYSHLKRQGFAIKLYTSGVVQRNHGQRSPLSEEMLDGIYIDDTNPEVVLNIQGHTPELVESINGVAGSYTIIEESIRNLRNFGIRYCAHVVPFRHNFMELNGLYEYCRKQGFSEMSFLRFVPQGRGRVDGLYNTPEEFKRIMNQLSMMIMESKKNDGMTIRLGCPMNFLFLLEHGHDSFKEYPTYCRGGMDAPLILPTGDVSMCPAWKDLSQFVAGNINHQDFEEIWNSDYFKTFRRFIQVDYRSLESPCGQCRHLETCRGKCVAQRLLRNSESCGKDLNMQLLSAPDPQCFVNLVHK